MKQYLKAQSKTNEIVIKGEISYDEIQRFSTADYRWAERRKGTISPDSETYKEIETLVLKKYFPSFQHEYEKIIHENRILKQQLIELKKLPYQF